MRYHLDLQVGRHLKILPQRRHSVLVLQSRFTPARVMRSQRLWALVGGAKVGPETQSTVQGKLLFVDQRRPIHRPRPWQRHSLNQEQKWRGKDENRAPERNTSMSHNIRSNTSSATCVCLSFC